MVVVETDEDPDELTLIAIDAGADDFETMDSTLHAYSPPDTLEALRRAMADSGAHVRSSELTMVPTNTVLLDDKTAKQTLNLLDQLEELDDTQKIFSNADFPDEVLDSYGNESG